MDAASYLKWNKMEYIRMVPELQDMGFESKNKWLKYQQLRTFIEAKISKINRSLKKFEKILIEEQAPTKKRLRIYDELLPSGPLREITGLKKWEAEMGNPLSEEEWEKIFEIIHKTTIASKYQERNYKIAMRWYRCPTALNLISKENSEFCWRCKTERGTMDHIWYGCQGVKAFWNNIFGIYYKVSGVEVTPSMKISLLSLTSNSIKSIKTDILHHMTSAARTLIARKWKEIRGPTIEEWICEMNKIQYMEKQIRDEGYIINQMPEIWQKWDEFWSSKEMLGFL